MYLGYPGMLSRQNHCRALRVKTTVKFPTPGTRVPRKSDHGGLNIFFGGRVRKEQKEHFEKPGGLIFLFLGTAKPEPFLMALGTAGSVVPVTTY
eukprot:1061208-Rhodomonas_salina.1